MVNSLFCLHNYGLFYTKIVWVTPEEAFPLPRDQRVVSATYKQHSRDVKMRK